MTDTQKEYLLTNEEVLHSLKAIGFHPDIIDVNRRYWFIRTESGQYFENFFFNDYVAIAWNEIGEIENDEDKDNILNNIERHYPTAQKGLVYNQIKRFCTEINKGDIVIIPSQSSDYLAFGVITGDVYIENINLDSETDECDWKKRRPVHWYKTINKRRIDPYLYQLLRSHHTLSCADSYSSFIDRTISDFFIKGDSAHLILRVETTAKIPAFQFVKILGGLLDRVDCLQSDYQNISSEQIDAKISVQSPGLFEFIATITSLGVLALIVVGLFGGKAKYTKKNSETTEQAEISTNGMPNLLDKIMDCYERYQHQQRLNNQEMHKLTMDLKMKDPSHKDD